MLQITPDAMRHLHDVRTARNAPEETGARLFAESGHIRLRVSAKPEEGDRVYEQEGVRVFVDRALTETLTESVIDIKADDGNAKLVVRRVPTAGARKKAN